MRSARSRALLASPVHQAGCGMCRAPTTPLTASGRYGRAMGDTARLRRLATITALTGLAVSGAYPALAGPVTAAPMPGRRRR